MTERITTAGFFVDPFVLYGNFFERWEEERRERREQCDAALEAYVYIYIYMYMYVCGCLPINGVNTTLCKVEDLFYNSLQSEHLDLQIPSGGYF